MKLALAMTGPQLYELENLGQCLHSLCGKKVVEILGQKKPKHILNGLNFSMTPNSGLVFNIDLSS